MVWFGFVCFYYINHCKLFNSKPFQYIFIKIYIICEHILLITFLNKPKLIFYHSLNGSKYCYVSLTIQLNINHLFPHS